MYILFDFEIWNDAALDNNLLGIMTCIRNKLKEKIEPIKNLTDKSNGVLRISFIPNQCGIQQIGIKEELSDKIDEIIKDFNFEYCINLFLKEKLN